MDSSELCEAASLPADPGQLETGKPLSKRQQKLLRRREQWMSHKAEKRMLRKEKRKEKYRERIESGVDSGPTRKMLKKNTMKESSCHINVAIDLSFDDLMSDKDIMKLTQQIQYCYSRNRRAAQPLQFYLTSLGKKTQERLDRIGDYHGWDINVRHEMYDAVFEKDHIVYLTSDSPNVLETLDSTKTYIIGGLVDHNHHKGLCFDLAVKKGVNHARFPIETYLQMNTRKVLAVNHVFEILLRFTETRSWEDAFFHVIPKRKHAVKADGHTSESSVADSENGKRVTVSPTESDVDTDRRTDSCSLLAKTTAGNLHVAENVTDAVTNGNNMQRLDDDYPINELQSTRTSDCKPFTGGDEVTST
jgi:tRNA (guanine9-N1)-methyltransferase